MFEQHGVCGKETQRLSSSFKLKGHCECYTVCLFILLGLSLQPLAKELLLFGQVLFYEAILAHLLTHLQHKKHFNNTSTL